MHPDYLEKILNAQVYDVAIETPLDLATNLSARIGNTILFKREDMQPVFSLQAARRLQQDGPAVAAGAQARRDLRLGRQPRAGRGAVGGEARLRAVIVMPTTTPQIKIDAVRPRRRSRAGGESYDDAYAHALELEKSEKLTFVHPFDDPT
jgi:threonine dehydratase